MNDKLSDLEKRFVEQEGLLRELLSKAKNDSELFEKIVTFSGKTLDRFESLEGVIKSVISLFRPILYAIITIFLICFY